MMFHRHPSPPRLQTWLERGTPSRVGRHVADCEHCLAALDGLSGLDDTLVAGLAEVLAPPAGIEDRTSGQLERRLRNEDALLTFLDIFSVGWTAMKLLFEDEEDLDG